jgi:hypothetical protein
MEIPTATISFKNFIEYSELEHALELHEHFNETKVLTPYSTVGLEEKWYLNTITNEYWRLIRPDPPFSGLWSKVD